MIQKKIFRLAGIVTMLVLCGTTGLFAQLWNPNHRVGTVTGKYHYKSTETPDQLVELSWAGLPSIGQSYLWEYSFTPTSGFVPLAGVNNQSSYSFGSTLTQTIYVRRRTQNILAQQFFSNVLKLQLVSANWEDLNYVREHTVLTTGITTWQAVDALTIGQKLQTTTYYDHLGRAMQTVNREVATTPNELGLWGDIVQFHSYDAYGRQAAKYLPYATTTESGKFKTNPATEQAAYHTSAYGESSPQHTFTFDNSPLNRVFNVKDPGAAWAASAGSSGAADMNNATDDVQRFTVDYIQGNPPVHNGAYNVNRLFKLTYTDVGGKQVVEYMTKTGQVVLKKIQLDNAPASAYNGWICTYFVYDDFDRLRYELQPEAVKYLSQNSWSFAGVNGTQVLNELCFQYNFDARGRLIWKKVPGVLPVKFLYDNRNRLVFTQDGNQSTLSTPQWTVALYDELDRQVASVQYNTTKTQSALQTDIDNAAATSVITISNSNNAGGGSPITLVTSHNPISSTDLNNPAVALVLTYTYYDNYAYAGAKTFNTGYTNLTAYSTSDPNVTPIATSLRTMNKVTGRKVRVLGATAFISSTQYYDQKGQQVQSLVDNIKSGVDISTHQYHFDGRLLSTCSDHTTAGTGYTNFKILTKNVFDKIGRVKSVHKQVGSNAMDEILKYDYDEMSRLKTKHLDPGYTANGQPDLESLTYSYNINNQITGINKDYALKNPANYNKWSHFFGMYLGYNNTDNVFTSAKLNGQVSGILWTTQGDDAQRRFDFVYDNANRHTNANFTEQLHPGDGWANNKSDYSVSGTSGKITYDLNGNLVNMHHKGVVPGSASPLVIDNLNYQNVSLSNKLNYVTDQMTTPSLNGTFGDLKDGANAAGTADYVYDDNGNVVVDLNKNVQSLGGGAPGTKGISYNFLNKPELIRIVGKGTIRIVYAADGSKLQRAYIPETGGPSVITTYIQEFVYQESATITTATTAPLGGTASMTYIAFGQGRIRVITPVAQNNGYDNLTINGNLTLPNSKMGVYDFYVTDYQQNVRVILTEEVNSAGNTATMETTRSTTEEPIFGQPGGGNELANTRFAKPVAWTDPNLGSSVSRLGNIATRNLGPNTLQKVMAGDKVTTQVSYYFQSSTGGNSTNVPAAILSSLTQSIGNGNQATSLVKGNATAITSQLNGTTAFINAVNPAGAGGGRPLAFLTILFFDERFNLIDAADGGVHQQQVAASVTAAGAPLNHTLIKAPKNGYVYVYVSNRSDQDVYFDNFAVSVAKGNIIEENHYYAYGLKIEAISSSKLGHINEGALKNDYLYNAKEFFDDGGLNWYDYGFRNYDPQIGRFPQLDPLTDKFPFLTPYQYASCDPITNIDIDGLEGASAVGTLVGAGADFSYQYAAAASNIVPLFRNVTTMVNTASNLSTIISITSVVLNTTATTLNLINGTSATQAVTGEDPYQNGLFDAMLNANTAGISDLVMKLRGTFPLDNYTDEEDKRKYLRGRIAGDLLVLVQAVAEDRIGDAALLASTVGGVSVVAGAATKIGTTIHSIGIGAVATADMAWATAQLLKLGTVLKMNETTPSSGNSGQTSGSNGGGAAGQTETGFDISGQLETVWNNKKFFENWLKGNQSLTRVNTPLNATEAQQIIDNAKRLGIRLENNPNGLMGLERTGQWGGIPHFKVGNTHIPIAHGLENILIF